MTQDDSASDLIKIKGGPWPFVIHETVAAYVSYTLPIPFPIRPAPLPGSTPTVLSSLAMCDTPFQITGTKCRQVPN